MIAIEAGCFGRFCLVHDPDASYDTLYPKKLIFEPTPAMSPGSKYKVWQDLRVTVKLLDMARLTRLCKD